jgi:hypothetical protein
VANAMGSHLKRFNNERFFSNIKDRLNTNIRLTPNFTAIVTVHGKTKAYLQRFNLIQSPECPCETGDQTIDHLIYDCTTTQREREKLQNNITKEDKWPVNKSELVTKHIKRFLQFVNSIDFEKL